MNQTGIVRKIDDLGRIVIPKEIRKTFRIREGDPFEIVVDNEGNITLCRYKPMNSIKDNAKKYVEAMTSLITLPICITDTESIIVTTPDIKGEYIEKNISEDLRLIIGDRTIWTTKTNLPIKITNKDDVKRYTSQIIIPIISNIDLIGSVIVFSKQTGKIVGDLEKEIATMFSKLLAEQLES